MTKDQLRFLASGLLFGFLLGYLVAFGVYEERVVGRAAPVPRAGNMGMSPGSGGGAPAAGAPGGDGEEMMERVFQEIAALREAIDNDPNDNIALFRLANLYYEVGKMDEARELLNQALVSEPGDVRLLIRMANTYHDEGDIYQSERKLDQARESYVAAVSYYGKALEVEPTKVDARTDMATCLRLLGRSDEAIAQLRTSLSQEPQHWQTWLNLGIVSLYDRNDVQTAAEAFEKLEQINPSYRDLPLLKEAVEKARQSSSKTPS